MTRLGLVMTFFTVAVLVVEFFRHRRTRLAAYGWVGLAGLIAAEWLMFRGFQPVADRLDLLHPAGRRRGAGDLRAVPLAR
jgi:uncharacterized membrane protein